jgi:hypothetical protein
VRRIQKIMPFRGYLCALYKNLCVFGSVCAPNIKILVLSGVFYTECNKLLCFRECLCAEYKKLCLLGDVCAPYIKICAFSGVFVHRI